ncbi:MAG: single-stranded DNA-binding protein [Clostridia bacterium]
MVTNLLENNHLVLVGKVTSEKTYSHEIYGEKFYIFDLEVARLSSAVDVIPITVSERLLTGLNLEIGKKLSVEGQFRSYNSYQNERNKLILTVFAKDIVEINDESIEESEESQEEKKDAITNEVTLSGYVCKKPIYRQTPFDREIADLLLAVNRAYNKSDYIPCIAWGRNARFCQNMEVGTEVKIVGRVQSRKYEKKFEDGTSETRVAYEVSISSMEIVEKKDETNEDVG